MIEISGDLQHKIDTLQNKYSLMGISVSIKYDQRNSRISLIKVNGNIRKFVVPEFVEMIGENCFMDNFHLEEVIINSKNFDLILENAFKNCIRLKKVDMSKSGVMEIGEEAFNECRSLVDIKFSNELIKLGAYIFDGCTSLEVLELPKGLSVIPQGMCHNCKSLIAVKHNALIVGHSAFRGSSLVEFNFETVKTIEFAAFAESKLTRIRLKDVNVESNAFRHIHEKIHLLEIDNVNAFCNKEEAEKTSLLFEECKIGTVVFKNVNRIPNACFSNTKIDNIKNMHLISYIENTAFFSSNIEHGVDLSNVEYIGHDAFSNSQIVWGNIIELGKSTPITIGDSAFEDAVSRNIERKLDKITVILIYNLKSLGNNSFSNFKDDYCWKDIQYRLGQIKEMEEYNGR